MLPVSPFIAFIQSCHKLQSHYSLEAGKEVRAFVVAVVVDMIVVTSPAGIHPARLYALAISRSLPKPTLNARSAYLGYIGNTGILIKTQRPSPTQDWQLRKAHTA